MIKNATEKKSRTFTELLHITKLPRKTLSLRLKELCETGALVKAEHRYGLNGASDYGDRGRSLRGIPDMLSNGKVRTGFMLVALLACFSVSGYVLAGLFSLPSPSEEAPEPVLAGTFTMALDIHDVENVFDWQVAIVYDSSLLTVEETAPGGFLGEEPPFALVTATDSLPDLLLLGGTLKGEPGAPLPGMSGSGRLATITFGYYEGGYGEPQIVEEKVFRTFLEDPQGSLIPIGEGTLTLTGIE